MYVSSLSIENLRCFEKAEVTFEHPDSDVGSDVKRVENVTLLLGDNGAGKTTILKGVALAVLAVVIKYAGFKPHFLVRRTSEGVPDRRSLAGASLIFLGQDKDEFDAFGKVVGREYASARIKSRGDYEAVSDDADDFPSENVTSFRASSFEPGKRTSERLFDDDSPALFLVGYGATRRVASASSSAASSEKERGLRYRRVASLFEEHVPLVSLNDWFPGLPPERHGAIVNLLDDLTPDDITFTRRFDDLQPIFTHRRVDLPFTALSDGYRGYVGMIADLLHHLNRACPDGHQLTEMSGVVMIDDVDLHLHPSWQRTVLQKLTTTLPRLQFIVTSHSPLVAASLYAQNIRVIESPLDGPSSVSKMDERIHGLNAAQVLTSEYFGLPSSRSQDQDEKLARMAEDVAKRGSPEASIAFLRELSGKNPE